jgi:hypothetical protein
MDPQVRTIFVNRIGALIIELPKYIASSVSTIKAGKPNKSSDRANPAMYVSGETGEATKMS